MRENMRAEGYKRTLEESVSLDAPPPWPFANIAKRLSVSEIRAIEATDLFEKVLLYFLQAGKEHAHMARITVLLRPQWYGFDRVVHLCTAYD
jgi:hypothetical protein